MRNTIELKVMLKKLINQYFKPKAKEKEDSIERKNGKWKEFNKHAILISEGCYNEGLRDGIWRFYYDTGELIIEEEYHLGKKHGKYTSYYRSGKLMSLGRFVDDLREGEFKVFSEEGEITKILVFKQDALIEEINHGTPNIIQRQLISYDLPMLIIVFTYLVYWATQIRVNI